MTSDDFEAGMRVRREMFGEAGVERMEQAPEFDRPFEELVTAYCFGAAWGREELSKRDRSLITIAALAALYRPNQLRAHIKVGLTNGLSPVEIREAIMHTSIYSGVPNGVEGMAAANEVLDQEGVEK